jgi:hypothetical protein
VENPDLPTALRAIPWARRTVLDHIGTVCGCDFDRFLKTYQPYLTTAQVKEMMRDGFEFGGHSIDHPLYAEIGVTEQLRQTRESMRFVKETFAPKRAVFAFPHMDRAVSLGFFDMVQKEGTVEATFGTSAPAKDSVAKSYQRFTMEKTRLTAAGVLGRQAVRTLKKRAIGGLHITRT